MCVWRKFCQPLAGPRLLKEHTREVESGSVELCSDVSVAVMALGRSRETIGHLATMLSAPIEDDGRFTIRTLTFGRMTDAAKGVEHFMCVDENEMMRWKLEGLPAIRREFEALVAAAELEVAREVALLDGSQGAAAASEVARTSRECMEYVLDAAAGSSERIFPNSPYPRDCDEHDVLSMRKTTSGAPMHLADFMECAEVKVAGLSLPHVAALRIYSTAAFVSINNPLRDLHRKERGEAHPLPLTVKLIAEAVLKLRAVDAETSAANDAFELYRGLKNVEAQAEFMKKGGTELAPMSTTSSIEVAVKYSQSAQSILFRLKTRSSMERGADITFLSTFPAEKEYLYPPLTYLQPGQLTPISLDGRQIKVLEVEPRS